MRLRLVARLLGYRVDLAAHPLESGLEIVLRDHMCSQLLAKSARNAFGLVAFHAGLAQGVAELQRIYHGLAHGVGSLLRE